MEAILTATITMLIILALAPLANNAFKASNLLATTPFFGSQSGRIVVLKYGSALVFLLTCFLCSSIAISYLIDANFLINASGESLSREHTKSVLERGFLMGVVGSRLLCISLPLLLWLIGPVLVLISSLAMLWVLYGLDYAITVRGLTNTNTICNQWIKLNSIIILSMHVSKICIPFQHEEILLIKAIDTLNTLCVRFTRL